MRAYTEETFFDETTMTLIERYLKVIDKFEKNEDTKKQLHETYDRKTTTKTPRQQPTRKYETRLGTNDIDRVSYTEIAENGREPLCVPDYSGSEDEDEMDDFSSDEEQPMEFEVERILDKRMVRRTVEYLLRWRGYESEDDTWEKKDNLTCNELIRDYESNLKRKTFKKGSVIFEEE
jgi:hypothetical protein